MVVELGLVLQGVHLVGRGREQDAGVRVFEQPSGQSAGLVGAVEQVLEALEFVQDDQVRFEGVGETLAILRRLLISRLWR